MINYLTGGASYELDSSGYIIIFNLFPRSQISAKSPLHGEYSYNNPREYQLRKLAGACLECNVCMYLLLLQTTNCKLFMVLVPSSRLNASISRRI
jgi:hypothetical protein